MQRKQARKRKAHSTSATAGPPDDSSGSQRVLGCLSLVVASLLLISIVWFHVVVLRFSVFILQVDVDFLVSFVILHVLVVVIVLIHLVNFLLFVFSFLKHLELLLVCALDGHI